MTLAHEITERLTMLDLYDRYGFEPNSAGFISCPFHEEKTPSLGLYDENRRWKCFGCGSGGSVIDFIMQLYHLGFPEACRKLNSDFDLALPICRRPTWRERQKLAYKEGELEQKRRAVQREREQIDAEYWAIFDEYLRLETNRNLYAPKSPDEPLHPKFVEALLKQGYQEYLLDMAEIRRRNFGNTNCNP